MNEGEMTSDKFHEYSTTLTSNPYKDMMKRRNFRPVSIMNIDWKILNIIFSSVQSLSRV